jgi:hypothetical protein
MLLNVRMTWLIIITTWILIVFWLQNASLQWMAWVLLLFWHFFSFAFIFQTFPVWSGVQYVALMCGCLVLMALFWLSWAIIRLQIKLDIIKTYPEQTRSIYLFKILFLLTDSILLAIGMINQFLNVSLMTEWDTVSGVILGGLAVFFMSMYLGIHFMQNRAITDSYAFFTSWFICLAILIVFTLWNYKNNADMVYLFRVTMLFSSLATSFYLVVLGKWLFDSTNIIIK